MPNRAEDDPDNEPSSPACSMHEADAAYMGYAGTGELIAFLNELLVAVRSGEPLTAEDAAASDLLVRHLAELGAPPSPTKTSGRIGSTGRVEDLDDVRNRVMRMVREMLPRVRDETLHADLGKLLRWHEAAGGIDRSGPATSSTK